MRKNVGGQAVIEGVMMRSPSSLAVALRRPNGEIAVRESEWRSFSARFALLKWPFVRGAVVLVESLHNGITSLTFSAQEAAVEGSLRPQRRDAGDDDAGDHSVGSPANSRAGAAPPRPEPKGEEVPPLVMGLTVALSLAFGVALFVVVPHLLTWAFGLLFERGLSTDDFLFHVVDTIFKLAIFVGYVKFISRVPEIRRVFEYHGAEHQSIHTYEAGEELTVDNARRKAPYHPRCGTSFLLFVIVASLVVFGVVFPFVPRFSDREWLQQAAAIGIKLPLLFPIAGIAYETIRFSGKPGRSARWRFLFWPGLAMQRLTAYRATDDQLEVALGALRRVLWREQAAARDGTAAPLPSPPTGEVEVFADYSALARAFDVRPDTDAGEPQEAAAVAGFG